MTKRERIVSKLASDIIESVFRAREYSDVPDEGTCNFDTPYIATEKGKISESVIKEAAELANVYCSKNYRGFFSGTYDLYGFLEGQASRRTKMAEAFANSLKNKGYVTGMKYIMD